MGQREDLVAAMAVFLIVDSIAIAARLYVRTKMLTRGFGLDDVVLIITYIGFIISCAMGFTSMRYGYAATDQQPYYDKTKATQFLFVNQLTLYISAGLVKLAVALVLYRLASTKQLRWVLIGSMVIVTIWTIVMTIFASWPCAQSGSSNWAGSKTCTQVGYFRTITNIFIDYFYALLPIYILKKVRMNTRLKISVMLLLGLGAFASSATIVKLVIIVRLSTAKGEEAQALHHDLLLWADIELGLATFAASAAALRPLLKHIPDIWSNPRTSNSHVTSEAVGPYRSLGVANEMHPMSKREGGTSCRDTEEQIYVV
ncbi:integral membrane protein [Rostrohypoxylon terebratum]|nr:integral membrane protein [Rostrohypoxylon terebratum]